MSAAATSADSDDDLTGIEPQLGPLGPINDGSMLLHAAKRSRMPTDRPTEHELAFFPELWEGRSVVDVFLIIRNTVLATWLTNQSQECTLQDVQKNLKPPFNSDKVLIQNVINYLTRYGKINFGRYVRVSKVQKVLPRDQRLVIVIGAGAAGIAAATQLSTFGFDVIIVEGRNRVGGRVQSIQSQSGQVMELGCDVFRNSENSPLITLMHQVNVRSHQTFKNTHIYQDGKPVSVAKDALMEKMYTHMNGALDWLAHEKEEQRDENGLFVSRQQVHENVFNMVERRTMMNYYNHCKASQETAKKIEHHYSQMNHFRQVALMADKMLTDLPDDSDDLLRRSLKRDCFDALKNFDEHLSAFELNDNHWIQHKKATCCKQYMHPNDFRIYNFLLGFEEFLYGAQLEKVQFSCQSNNNKGQGSTIRLEKGIANMLEHIVVKRQLDVRLNYKVEDIDYNPFDHVTLTITKDDGDPFEMHPSFVVCTLPIGVLKKSIANDERTATFSPPLPEKVVKAIRNMGSALINKVILVFDRAFWELGGRHQFCNIAPSVQSRASMLVWTSVPGSKVLTTYLAGTPEIHDLPDIMLVANAMNALQKIFPVTCPKDPLSYHVTRWHKDEFAFGSGSYMGLRTEKEDYDTLLEPLKTSDGKSRIYFAGEHTSLNYSNTIQGAWLSGMRAAADLANEHLGVGFVQDPKKASTSSQSDSRTHRIDYDAKGRRLDIDG